MFKNVSIKVLSILLTTCISSSMFAVSATALPLNEVPLFMRKNKLLPLCKPTDRTDNIDTSRFEVIAYADRPCEYVLYDDDGYTTDYDKPEHFDSIAIKEDVNGKFVVFSNKQIVKVSLFN